MQSNIGFISTAKAVLKVNGGSLKSLYDSNKWEHGKKPSSVKAGSITENFNIE